MAKDNKYTLTVGDQELTVFMTKSTGITDYVERRKRRLTRRQFRTPKIQKAVAVLGHLIIIADKSEIEK